MARVILVEDDADLQNSLLDCLEIMGHSTLAAESAVDFYQKLQSDIFEVAVVDINLPYYDGFSIVEYLSENSNIKIIIMSVRDALEDRVHGYRSGADIYMTKPIDPEELSAAISSLAGKKRAEHPSASAVAWVYRVREMELTAPTGAIISLTRREARFVSYLALRPSSVVTREEALRALGDADTERSRRNLDTLLSRLRTKVKEATGASLPIDTVQGRGFSATQEIVVEGGLPADGA
ncbi:response regulator transcription factor [Amorphus sp. 3PC139-8]|uniref:response regulator transcription factor n=1 Tax=Amorphus sp. 3PC139-8 TaxID=2735676 RepID=UPI00345D3DDC